MYIRNISHNDPNSYFIVSVDDQRPNFLSTLLLENGIHPSRFVFKMLSDGTYTYIYFRDWNHIDRKEDWNETANTVQKWVAAATKGEKMNFPIGFYNNQLAHHAYYLSTYNHSEMWMSLPDMIYSKDEYVQSEITKMHKIKATVPQYWEKFNEEEKAKVLDLTNFNKTEFEEKYMQGKPLLIIIGTTMDKVWKLGGRYFYAIMNETITKFSDYRLVYKSHPATPINSEMREYFQKNGIEELTLKVPIEIVLMTIGDKISYGGFASTAYIEMKPSQIKFFYAANSSELLSPFPDLEEQGKLGDAIFINPEIPDPTPLPTMSQTLQPTPESLPAPTVMPTNTDNHAKFTVILGSSVAAGSLLTIILIVFLVFVIRKKKRQIEDNSVKVELL